jgi:hypothetical protein
MGGAVSNIGHERKFGLNIFLKSQSIERCDFEVLAGKIGKRRIVGLHVFGPTVLA